MLRKRSIFCTLMLMALFMPSVTKSSDRPDSTRTDSVLTKGTWMSGLNGYLASTSQDNQLGSGSTGDFINNYNFEIRSGVLLNRRIAAGLLLNAQRESNQGNGFYESDLLGTGIWSRYFLGSMPYGRFYPELTVFYANLQESRTFNYGNFSVTESLRGKGVGIKAAFGFTYFVNKNIGLDVNYGAQVSKIWGDQIDFGTSEPYRLTTVRATFLFSFGFVVMLDEFFF